jgi:16S rRNA G966 N2-methylase RsmD
MESDSAGLDVRENDKHGSISKDQELIYRLKKIEELENFKTMKDEITNTILFLKEYLFRNPNYSAAVSNESNDYNASILEGLEQALKAYSLDRCRYYVRRALKSLTSVKTGKINDLNMNRWKSYPDIITDSLWIVGKRDRSGAHNASYWGNFIPQIPQQLLKRYTKRNDWVLDAFAGSGTTLIECQRTGRNSLGIDLSEEALNKAKINLSREQNPYGVEAHLVNADSTAVSYRDLLAKYGINSIHLAIMHPPYWDIIKFSEDERDLSNAGNVEQFLQGIRKIAHEIHSVLEEERYLALVIGDKYSKGEWIPLGFYSMNEVMKEGYRLKSTIVKNFDVTRGKKSQQELWRYRALAGGFYVFKHEYIFLFQK